MANDTTQAAEKTAQHLEEAVRSNDAGKYDEVHKEVDEYRKSHSETDTKAYASAITNKLEQDKLLPAVSMFEAKQDFDKMDTNTDGELSQREIKSFREQRQVNELKQLLLDNVINDQDRISNLSSDHGIGFSFRFGKDKDISKADLDSGLLQEKTAEKNRVHLSNLFSKAGSEQQSLYDRIKDSDGNGNVSLDTINEMLKNKDSLRPKLNVADENSLKFLQQTFQDNTTISKHDLQNLCTTNGLDYNKQVPEEALQREHAFKHLFKGDGQSLLDTLKDAATGEISAEKIQSVLDDHKSHPGWRNLTAEDLHCLKYMQADLKNSAKPAYTADELKAEKKNVDEKVAADEAEAAKAKAQKEEAAKAKAKEEEAAKVKAKEEEAAKVKAKEEEAAKVKAKEEEAAKAKAKEEEAAKAKEEAEAKAAREAHLNEVTRQVKEETSIGPVRCGEGYYDSVKRAHPEMSEEDAAKEAHRIKYEVYHGRSELKVGEQLRTVTPEQEQEQIRNKMEEYELKRCLKQEGK